MEGNNPKNRCDDIFHIQHNILLKNINIIDSLTTLDFMENQLFRTYFLHAYNLISIN